MEILAIAFEKIQMYIGNSWHYGVFVIALLYLLFFGEKKNKAFFGWYILGFFLIYFCPLTAGVIMKYCIGEDVYWRMLWLLPIPLVIAYAGTRLIMSFGKRYKQCLAAILMGGIIIFTGTSVYEPGVTPYVKAENLSKLPKDAVEVAKQILTHGGDGYICVTAPADFNYYLRQYDGRIRQTLGRRYVRKRQNKLMAEMYAENPEIKKIVKYTRKLGGNYLVYPTSDQQHETLLEMGYHQIGDSKEYRIYFDTKYENSAP